MRRTAVHLLVVFGLGIAWGATVRAEPHDDFQYREAKYGPAELKRINGLPVLFVEGTPAEIGEQAAALVLDGTRLLLAYPRNLMRMVGLEGRWPALLTVGRQLIPQFPRDHLAELEAFAKKAQIDRDLLIGVNTMVDAYRGGFGCSSLLVSPERSKTGGPLFGRNLDFYTQGTLHKYSLVIVCRPKGKHAFASVGFPGMFGCLSGMNDAGLALAMHEVFVAGDGASLFNPRGTPYTLVFRRILEECTTVEEAEKLVRSIGRTTLFNLALCDRRGGVVLEATPRTVAVRRGEDGILACTNHFRSAELGTMFRYSWRHQALMASSRIPQLDRADVARKLHEVNQGRLTLQTMIFEPAALRLHLAIGACPSSALPLAELNLKPLFEGRRP